MKDVDLAYIAGFLDADGSITIHRRKQRKGRKHPQFMLYIYLVNRDVEILNLCREEFGGQIRQNTSSKLNPNWSPCYEWRIACMQAESFLRVILIYLRQKHRQADLALEFRALFSPSHRSGLPPDVLAERERLYLCMRDLNHRLPR